MLSIFDERERVVKDEIGDHLGSMWSSRQAEVERASFPIGNLTNISIPLLYFLVLFPFALKLPVTSKQHAKV